MTLLRAPELTVTQAAPTLGLSRSRIRPAADLMAGVLAIAALELVTVHSGGGRDEGAVTKGLVAAVPAFLLARPWTRLPGPVLLAAVVPLLGALLMCVLAPTAWAGADQLATVGYAALLFLVVASLGSSPHRRAVLAAALAGTGVLQACYGLWVWSAGGDVTRPVIGTYFWHNPFAAHVAAAALLLLSVAASRPWGRRAVVAAAGAAVCSAAVLLSTSRATTGLLVLLSAVLVARLLRSQTHRRRVLLRVLGTTLASGCVVLALAGPSAVGAGEQQLGQRTSDESLTSSGGHRWDFYKAALRVVANEPWVGVGAGGYTAAASPHQGPLEARARNVHNGLLQAAVEGGVPLAVAYTLPLVLGAWAFSRRWRAAAGPDQVLLEGAGAAAGLLILHSLVDFDWTFPALPVLLAAVLGLVVAVPRPVRSGRPSRTGAMPFVLCSVLVLIPLSASLRADAADSAVRSRTLPTTGLALVGADGPLRDPRFDRLLLESDVTPETQLRAALRRTADEARLDITLEWARATALVRLGETDTGLELAAQAWERVRDSMPLQAVGLARVLDEAGQPDEAEKVLIDRTRYLLLLGPAASSRVDGLLSVLLARPTPSSAFDCLVRDVARAIPTSRIVPPSGPRPAGCS